MSHPSRSNDRAPRFSHKLVDDDHMRLRVVRILALQYWSFKVNREHAPDKVRQVYLLGWSLSRGPYEGIYAGLDEADDGSLRSWDIRASHPAIIAAHQHHGTESVHAR